tara:strand:- start:9645 stop:13070 length:3426 start_codon:yes stop_codon:yes gene_type:complete
MPLISGTIPSLINGVSQQPATLRLPTQGEKQENGLSHIARGLEKRPCTEHVTEVAGVTSSDSDDVFIHTIRRSEDEAYALIVKGGSTSGTNGAGSNVAAEAKLIDLTGYATGTAGSEVYIRSAETSSDITSSNALLAAVQTYLGNFGPNEVFKPNKLSATTIADFTFLLNKTQLVKQSTTTTEDRDYESLVYFKVGDYGADYKITIKEFNVDSDGVMDNNSLRNTTVFHHQTPDNKVKSISGSGSSPNNESLNNQQAVVVSNIAYELFYGGTQHRTLKCKLVGGDPAEVKVDGTQTLYTSDTANTSKTGDSVYDGAVGVLNHGSYNPASDSNSYAGGLHAFNNATGSGDKGEFFTVSNASGGDLTGSESIIHIKNSKYPFTVEVTDGKGDSYMRAINGHDEVAQFGYLPGSKVPSGFIAKISGDRSSGQDDYYVKWMDGVWKECAQPVYPGGTANHSHATLTRGARTTIDNTTMPVQLYKNFGTVDGVANQIYFVLNTVDWGIREKGDTNTNPFPSFANYAGDTPLYTINDIFFHRNRLGFISDENVILSEVGSYFNFFHTTVLSVLDTAVIDVAVSNNQVAILKSAIPFQESLILFSDLQQFKLTSDQFLTPTSVTVDVATNFETSTDAKPVAAGKTIFFPFQRGAYSGIREYFIDVASETNDANEISAHVPEYIEGVVKKLAVSSNEEVLLISSSTNRKELYVYKYYYNDKEKLQSAWSKWTFDADLIDVAFVGSIAFMLFRRGDGSNDKVYLEKLNLSVDSAIAVEDDKIGIRLDRRVKLTNEDLLADSTPAVTAWQINQSLTAVDPDTHQTNVSGSGSGRTFSITTDANGQPTVFTTALGTGYVAGNVVRLTDPGSTNNTADVTIANPLPYTDVDWDKITDSSVKVDGSNKFGSKIPIKGLDTGGTFFPRVGQTFTIGGKAGETFEVLEAEVPDATQPTKVTISITPSIAKESALADNTVLTFKERVVEYIIETGEKVKGATTALLEANVASYLVKGTDLSQQRGNTQPVIYAGIPYDFKYQFSQQFVKNNDNSINSGRLQIRNFEISYDKTGFFEVTVSPEPHDALYRDITTSEFTGVIVGTSLLGNKTLETGVYRVPVYVNSKDVKITVSSDSWYPLALQSADWEAMQVLRNQRI